MKFDRRWVQTAGLGLMLGALACMVASIINAEPPETSGRLLTACLIVTGIGLVMVEAGRPATRREVRR